MIGFSTSPKARKAYPCTARKGCIIQPGERYWRRAIPPWVMVCEDPDEPAAPLGEWMVARAHSKCADEWWWHQ